MNSLVYRLLILACALILATGCSKKGKATPGSPKTGGSGGTATPQTPSGSATAIGEGTFLYADSSGQSCLQVDGGYAKWVLRIQGNAMTETRSLFTAGTNCSGSSTEEVTFSSRFELSSAGNDEYSGQTWYLATYGDWDGYQEYVAIENYGLRFVDASGTGDSYSYQKIQ